MHSNATLEKFFSESCIWHAGFRFDRYEIGVFPPKFAFLLFLTVMITVFKCFGDAIPTTPRMVWSQLFRERVSCIRRSKFVFTEQFRFLVSSIWQNGSSFLFNFRRLSFKVVPWFTGFATKLFHPRFGHLESRLKQSHCHWSCAF